MSLALPLLGACDFDFSFAGAAGAGCFGETSGSGVELVWVQPVNAMVEIQAAAMSVNVFLLERFKISSQRDEV
ncbi:hypothetical protein [Leucobacter sp. cx-169]|uniref:hypothetical protein n=1 Tax=Leucobacter sp. cx-169 TaxID=2770549 RepID=UPI00165E5355|nr:hypothetical protein [Leucobacter sp. cx-169]